LRKIVKASLPLGVGIIYDPFAGSGSTLAAAAAVGHLSVGTDRDPLFFEMAVSAFCSLRDLPVD
jgi:DNA modification methylase